MPCICSWFLSRLDVSRGALCVSGTVFVWLVVRLYRDHMLWIKFLLSSIRRPSPWHKTVQQKSEYPFTNWQKGPVSMSCYVINIDICGAFTPFFLSRD